MKLGVSTWSLLHKDVYSAVKTIGDAGFEYIELWGEVPHAYHDWVDKKRLKDVLSSYGMVVTTHAPFTGLNPGWPFQPVKGAIEKTLEGFVDFSDFLGASIVSFHPGNAHTKVLEEQSFASAVSTLRRMVKAADGRLVIDLENQTRSQSVYDYPIASSMDAIERILGEVDGSKFTLDTGHAHVSDVDPEFLSRRVGARLAEVHLSDNTGDADDHLIPGKGTAKLSGLLKRLSGSDVFVCLELNPFKNAEAEIIRTASAWKSALSLS